MSEKETNEQRQLETERSEVNRAIREGLADIDAGNYRPLREFMDEFRRKHNLSEDPPTADNRRK